MRESTCPTCGREVGIDARGFAWNLSKQYDNGARYKRGAHSATCDGGAARREAVEAYRRHERSQRRAAGAKRYLAVYAQTRTPEETRTRAIEILDYVYPTN